MLTNNLREGENMAAAAFHLELNNVAMYVNGVNSPAPSFSLIDGYATVSMWWQGGARHFEGPAAACLRSIVAAAKDATPWMEV